VGKSEKLGRGMRQRSGRKKQGNWMRVLNSDERVYILGIIGIWTAFNGC